MSITKQTTCFPVSREKALPYGMQYHSFFFACDMFHSHSYILLLFSIYFSKGKGQQQPQTSPFLLDEVGCMSQMKP